ncbi:hypothetical protein CMI37_19045 [Candidatus Pacearchaeota archaeon]|nr:hypothetical protein [Candidatus Pacearchaeota archaeon]|tara:strand:+ start:220 stop:567 length:348 start_codon:yes stop_codon:yes gene_type:complete
MFGPDGKPINSRQLMGGQLLGQPKTLDDVKPFSEETIEAFADGALQMLSSGMPLEVPGAMPMGQIAQCAKTMRAQQARIKELEEELALLKSGEEQADDTESSQLDLTGLIPSQPE